ncbi:vomeronasal type-2 receptor 26 [Xenopus laevis]|uniref:G-protein coupled receptors family 3 profile domain-containing protein n=2 Tax=Xenopus laevis TaxID=8355 RepID=A0A974C9C3_XENLA|nr:vomeronasal type-2 receptor 26 [Xenopus laevis]OCT68966.1 hypothetical protein XELAEV_18040274mg [Xenopus laevis]
MVKHHWNLLTVILILLMFPGNTGNYCTSRSKQLHTVSSSTELLDHSVDGDIIIGGILQIFLFSSGGYYDFHDVPDEVCCVGPSFQYLAHLLAFVYAIKEINNNSKLLPNVTLGYHVYDACTSEVMALMSTLSLISKDGNPFLNYICQQDQKLVAFVGHLLSSPTHTTAEITQFYGYPQISYGALDSVFNDRVHFPSVYRTVPNEYSQFTVIIKLLKHFGWTWVGIIASDDESNHQASEELKKEMGRKGICVDFLKLISNSPKLVKESATKSIEVIKHSSVKVIILFLRASTLLVLLNSDTYKLISERVWISSVGLDIVAAYEFKTFLYSINGSFLISLPKGAIPGFNNFLSQAIWSDILENTFVKLFWGLTIGCLAVFNYSAQNFTCPDEHKIEDYLLQEETINHRIKYTIYMAVYALAHGLDAVHSLIELSSKGNIGKIRSKLNYYLKNIVFKMSSEEEIFFTKDGNIPGKFDILNWVIYENGTIKKISVGRFLPGSQHLITEKNAIAWSPYFQKTPISLCTDKCSSGHRKAHQTGRPSCCFDCLPCPEGEISNSSDLETCVKCPEDQWSNPVRNQCIKKTIDYLTYGDVLGYTMSGCASVFIVFTAAVFLVFITHRGTPIVRANNENISYILLMALLMLFLCSFMFIGHPTGVTCILRQTTVMFVLSIAISSLLGKTVTVLVAFKVTKTSSNFRRWGKINYSMSVIFLLSFGEFLICVVWLTLSPPYVESDIKTIPGEIILQCNEGTIISFYLAVSYIGVLSLCSFTVAFIARKLPDRFNEAQHITFSMLVFCSVWASFIPTYLSTKGKHMVAVEIFAIQASAAGLLICIFTPKCYIIVMKPELNVKGKLIIKSNCIYTH